MVCPSLTMAVYRIDEWWITPRVISPSSESRNSSIVGQGVEALRFGAGEVRRGFRPAVLERLRAARAISSTSWTRWICWETLSGSLALISVVVQSPLFTEKQG